MDEDDSNETGNKNIKYKHLFRIKLTQDQIIELRNPAAYKPVNNHLYN